MSVINQVLKDLDRQGANTSAPTGVIAVNQRAATSSHGPWLWLLLPGLLLLAAAAWWFWPVAPGPGGATAPAPVLPPAAPELRLSHQLSPVAEPAPTPPSEATPAPVPGVVASPAIIPATPPRLDTRLPEPRPRLPVQPPAEARPSVVKDIKPLTPQAQAEEAWRQASRWLEQGRDQAAQEQLENVLRLDPAHAGARQRLVALVQEAGDSARAEALLREGLALSPNDSWYARSLAQLHLQRGDSAQAAAILKTSLARHADAANWGLYASTLAKLGRPGDAAAAYREALRLNPAPGNWWIGLAVALEQSGARADAGAAYQRALQTALSGELREFAQQKAGELGVR